MRHFHALWRNKNNRWDARNSDLASGPNFGPIPGTPRSFAALRCVRVEPVAGQTSGAIRAEHWIADGVFAAAHSVRSAASAVVSTQLAAASLRWPAAHSAAAQEGTVKGAARRLADRLQGPAARRQERSLRAGAERHRRGQGQHRPHRLLPEVLERHAGFARVRPARHPAAAGPRLSRSTTRMSGTRRFCAATRSPAMRRWWSRTR